MTQLSKVTVKIGDIVFVVSSEQKGLYFNLSPDHQNFDIVDNHTDIHLNYLYFPESSGIQENLVFASGGPWSLYRQGEKFFIPISCDSGLYRLAIIDQAFTYGLVYIIPCEGGYCIENYKRTFETHLIVDPFEYPLDEVIIMNYLAQGRGVILHACGVVEGGQGVLFVGVSGAGKSTIAELWKKTNVTLLSDDRIIVRRDNDRLRMYGTPWHGDAGISSPESAPLERLFFIEHATRHYVKELSPVEAATRLLVRCFPPFYDKPGMEFTLDFLAQIAEEIPCYELGFVPDASAIDFVRGVK